jgi:transposase
MYPSDLTDVQWSKLEPLLKEPRGDRHAGGRPCKYPLRRVVDALLYVVKTGCQWRQLSADFPPWLSVHQQFRACRDSGFWERITKTLREQGRQAKGRNASPDFLLVVESCPIKERTIRCPFRKQLNVRRTCCEDRWEHHVRCPGAPTLFHEGLVLQL